MGKPHVGRLRWPSSGGGHELVRTRARGAGPTTPGARTLAGQSRHAVGMQSASRLRSRLWHRALARTPLELSGALCGALEEGNKLLDAAGQERKAWEIARGKRSWGTQANQLWHTHSRVYRSTRVLALPVRHPSYPGPLWLVVVRQGKGREPWYLLTDEPVETEEQAWDLTFSYVSRWKIEEEFRFQKTELLIESLRLRDWEPRRKLLLLVTLAYGFLLWSLAPSLLRSRAHLLVHWQQRADWRQWKATLPLYRLRWALSRLWLTHPPSFVRSGWRPYRPLSHITWPACSFPWWMTLWHQCGYLF